MNNTNFKLTVIVALIAALSISVSQASVATGYTNSTSTSGDKCVSCVLSRYYFCVGVTTKVRDCYSSITDC